MKPKVNRLAGRQLDESGGFDDENEIYYGVIEEKIAAFCRWATGRFAASIVDMTFSPFRRHTSVAGARTTATDTAFLKIFIAIEVDGSIDGPTRDIATHPWLRYWCRAC